MVNTKDQSNALCIVYAMFFVDEDQSMVGLNILDLISMSALSIQNAKTHLYSVKFKSQLTMKLEKKPPK